ncbi:MAG: YicC/YloC family endoribonuclease [Gemmatimonadota bacterium]
MIRSMTGYGEAERDTPAGRLRAEARSVNHRFFSLNTRIGRGLDRYEPQLREWLRTLLPRGHVSFSIRVESEPDETGDELLPLQVNRGRARQYLRLLRELNRDLGLEGDVDLSLLSRFTELVSEEDETEKPVPDEEDVRAVTVDAARAVVRMREQEGMRLADDLEGRLDAMETALVHIALLAPARLVTERDRMRRVVAELLESVPVDEDRIAREVAHLAERWDISEELVRLRSHIELFRENLAEASADPVGKRLGFLTQEMNRETNTIGSKANDAAIEHQVIAVKDEIERLREQIENVE